MSIYVFGDVRGNYNALTGLLEQIQFDRRQDRLCFTGNLVNGAPQSLEVLRFVKDLGKQAICILGHEELRLLSIAEGVEQITDEDHFDEFLSAPDRDDLLKWLSLRPLLHQQSGFTLVHAGIPAEWSLSQAQTFATEAESSLSMGNRRTFFENIAGDEPTRWHAKHRGWKRLRYIVNSLTRMHYFNGKGRMDFSCGADVGELIPWYDVPQRAMVNNNIVFSRSAVVEESKPQNVYSLFGHNNTLRAMELSTTPEFFTVAVA